MIRNVFTADRAGDGVALTAIRAGLIVIAGFGVGFVTNVLSEPALPLKTPERAAVKDLIEWQLFVEGTDASLEEAYEAFKAGGTIFLDARSRYSYGVGHIPSARSLPVSEYRLRRQEILADVEKSQAIITYCSGGSCQTSVKLATKLMEDGFTNVRAFYGGWGEWAQAGYPREGTSQ